MLSNSQIKKCNKCGAEITFAKSNSGKWYPADVDRSSGKPEMAYTGLGGILPGKRASTSFAKLHRCTNRQEIEATINSLRERLMAEEAALENGEWGIDTNVTMHAIAAWEAKLI